MNKKSKNIVWLSFCFIIVSALTIMVGTISNAAANQVKLKISHQFTEDDPRHLIIIKWLEEVSRVTENRVTGKIYPHAQLGGAKEAIGQTTDGIVDVSTVSVSYLQGLLPESSLFSISPVPANFRDCVWCCMDAVYNRLDERIQKSKIKLVGAFSSIGAYVFFTREPIAKLNDLKGKKMRTAGGPDDSSVFRELGMIPVNMGAADQYQALQTGVVDGVGTATSSYIKYRLYEVAPYAAWVPFKYPPYLIMMNINTWNKISPEDRAMITDLYPAIRDFSRNVPGGKKEIEDVEKLTKGDYYPSAEETDAWTAPALSVRKKWMEKVGDDTARRYFDLFGACSGTKWFPEVK